MRINSAQPLQYLQNDCVCIDIHPLLSWFKGNEIELPNGQISLKEIQLDRKKMLMLYIKL